MAKKQYLKLNVQKVKGKGYHIETRVRGLSLNDLQEIFSNVLQDFGENAINEE
jgi:hypothetical protein